MEKNINNMVMTRLQMDEEDLYLEIARQDQPAGILHSPESYKKRAAEILADLLPQIRRTICENKAFHDLPELALALKIFAVISHRTSIAVACAAAAYLAKRGLKTLCPENIVNE